MQPMKRASRKKVEISLSNWVLGGDLISIVEGKQEDTRKDVREVKHRRKAFMRKPDGTYSTIDLPEDFEYSSTRRHRRKSSGVTGVSIKVNNGVDIDIDETDTDGKAEQTETEDEKIEEKSHKKNRGHGGGHKDVDDFKGMKWCKICKVPSPFGTLDTMPDGAMKAYCSRCDKDHWVRQNNHIHEDSCEEVKVVTEKKSSTDDKKSDDNNDKKTKNGGNGGNGNKQKKNGNGNESKDKEKSPEPETKKDDTATDDEAVTTWTAEQDKTILDMKAVAGNSWADIASAVNSDRDAVKERYRELQKNEPKTEQAKQYKPSKRATVTEDNNGMGDDFGADLFSNNMSEDDANVLAGLDDLLAATAPFEDEKNDNGHHEKTESKQNKHNNNNGGGNNNGGKKKGGKNGNGGNGKNNTQHQKPTEEPSYEPSSFQSNSPTNSPNSSPKCIPKSNKSSSSSKAQNPDNGEFHFGPRFYGKLKPDAVWSKDDCDLLEHLLERYDNEKWLHMQANFYNWTGRMIAAEFIEKKFKADYGASTFEEK